MKISVVMPTYNAARFLRTAVESILNQTFSDFEFIIVDDASSDGTREILSSYKDERIRIVDGPRSGIVAALNRGLDLARGEYVARMDADDISFPDRFAKQVDFLDSHPDVGVCGTLVRDILEDGTSCLGYFSSDRFTQMNEKPGIFNQIFYDPIICHPTVMFRASILKKYGFRYNEDLKNTEDQELWARMLRYGIVFYNIQEALFSYRHTSSSATSVYLKKHPEEEILWRIKVDLLRPLLPCGDYSDINNLKRQVGYAADIFQKGNIWRILIKYEKVTKIISKIRAVMMCPVNLILPMNTKRRSVVRTAYYKLLRKTPQKIKENNHGK